MEKEKEKQILAALIIMVIAGNFHEYFNAGRGLTVCGSTPHRFRFSPRNFVCYDYIHIRFFNPVDGGIVDLERLSACGGVQWDEGNSEKNWGKHRITRSECEQIFFNLPFVIADDQTHSQNETRFYALGRTDRGRKLFVVFTIRDSLIRVISARNMSRAEREVYDEKENSEVRE